MNPAACPLGQEAPAGLGTWHDAHDKRIRAIEARVKELEAERDMWKSAAAAGGDRLARAELRGEDSG